MPPLRVGVIGLGHLGKFHAENYAKLAKKNPKILTLAALCDSQPSGEANAKAFSVTFFKDFRQLDKKVDAVSIVVPTTFHHDVGMFFLERGIACLIEKPLAKTVQEAQELVAKAAEKNAILQVGHVERFNPIDPLLRYVQ